MRFVGQMAIIILYHLPPDSEFQYRNFTLTMVGIWNKFPENVVEADTTTEFNRCNRKKLQMLI